MDKDNKDVYRGHTFEEFIGGLRPIQGKLLITDEEGHILIETDLEGAVLRENKCVMKKV